MSRSALFALLAGTGLACVLLYAGCQKRDDKPVAGPALKRTSVKPDALFEGWEKPRVVLVFSGEMHGYIEPCGCSETQSGGLARRADLFEQIRKRGWPAVGLDLGGLSNKARLSRKQSVLKFDMILRSLKQLGYATITLGAEEMILEREHDYSLLLGQTNILQDESLKSPGPAEQPAFLSSNVSFEKYEGQDVPVPRQLIEAGGLKIGVLSVLGREKWNEIGGPQRAAEQGIEYVAPTEAIKAHLPELQQKKPDLIVLLSHASLAESQKLAKEFPQFGLVVSAGYEEPTPEPITLDNGVMVFSLGHKGKRVAAVGFDPAAESQIQYESIDLDKDRFKTHPSMVDEMEIYQGRLKDERLAETEAAIPHPSRPNDTYVGAEACGKCHTRAYQKWKGSKHAHAFESLIKGREGTEDWWVSRIHDAECLACHVTGWSPQDALRYDGGFVSETETPNLVGQQCENCHGPGGTHTKLEEMYQAMPDTVDRLKLLESRGAIKLTKATVEKTVCIKCHDYENSPEFNFEKYWEEVKHPWRD